MYLVQGHPETHEVKPTKNGTVKGLSSRFHSSDHDLNLSLEGCVIPSGPSVVCLEKVYKWSHSGKCAHISQC